MVLELVIALVDAPVCVTILVVMGFLLRDAMGGRGENERTTCGCLDCSEARRMLLHAQIESFIVLSKVSLLNL